MGKGKNITEYERGQIKAYQSKGMSLRDIAKEIGRSKTFVEHALNRGLDNTPDFGNGRPKILSNRDQRRILREASNKKISCKSIKEALNLLCHPITINRVLNNDPNINRKKMATRPVLYRKDKPARLAFAKQHMDWTDKWKSVVFSDEKKFNLDGPDGDKYYWHDLRKEERIFSKRNFGGGSLMIWLAFSRDNRSDISIIKGTLNSERYTNILNNYALPLTNKINPQPAIFQQDKASIHTSKFTVNWLKEKNIETMAWPTRSPDLNPAENILGCLARAVYKDCRHFSTTEELENAIINEWKNLPQKIFENTVDSMPDRIFEVISKCGGNTSF